MFSTVHMKVMKTMRTTRKKSPFDNDVSSFWVDNFGEEVSYYMLLFSLHLQDHLLKVFISLPDFISAVQRWIGEELNETAQCAVQVVGA